MDATARRRWLGLAALLGAVVLLAVGLTVLKGRLGPLGFLIYWLICLGLTGLAILMALLDLRAVQSRSWEEQHRLLEGTIEKIKSDARGDHLPKGMPRSEIESSNSQGPKNL